jgi:surfactin synthase thioesterase subunit
LLIIREPEENALRKIKLFCLPYAGGAAAIFNKWKPFVDNHLELRPVELAGRGKRIYDPLYQSVQEAVEDVYSMLSGECGNGPYAIFGHSMGAIIGYELACKFRENGLPAPIHLFFSGRGAPGVPYEDEDMYHLLPEDQFKEKVIELGGTPQEFFDHPELLEVLLPLLRSDFKIAETYEHSGAVFPFDHDITVFIGKEEDATAEQIDGWKNHTSKICRVNYFEGDHFFLNEHAETIVRMVNHTLLDAYNKISNQF